MTIGIDKIGYYVPEYYLDMAELAKKRGVDVGKYKVGIGQEHMALIPPHEDIVTMAMEAAYDIVQGEEEQIDLILFASESGVDFSKSAGNYVHKMLGIQPRTRVLEVKQACYACSGALQLASDYVKAHPEKKALVLSSDVAWYGFESAGEVTQGAGAIALLVSANPRLAVVHPGDVVVDDLPDFYRPSYSEVPVVDGKLSIRCYQDMLKKVAPETPYLYTCFHMPFANMANKANAVLPHPMSQEKVDLTKAFGRYIGNIYNGSLYLSLLSVLTHAKEPLANQTIGMFSYGSGAIGEYFTVTLTPTYDRWITRDAWLEHLNQRTAVSFEDYETLMKAFSEKEHMRDYQPPQTWTTKRNRFVLDKIHQGHRYYKKTADSEV